MINFADMIWERCCTGVDQVRQARDGNASRVELCSHLELDGLTPSHGDIEASVALGIPVNVMVRPRGGRFVYSEEEVFIMLEQIEFCGRAGASAVVAGCLDDKYGIDVAATSRLVERAARFGLGFTFHRAFDLCPDKEKSLEELIDIGCTRVLTSGGAPTAMEGASVIARLLCISAGRIIVMPGGGVTPSNVSRLQSLTGASEFHGTRLY